MSSPNMKTHLKCEILDSVKICQCCLYCEGDLRDMLQVHMYNGVEEVYQSMLQDCFSIQITLPSSGSIDMLICTTCISKLRDAMLFKHQVEETQNQLKQLQLLYDTSLPDIQVKEEVFFDEDVSDYSDVSDVPLREIKTSKVKTKPSSEAVLKKALERTKKNLQLLKGPKLLQTKYKEESQNSDSEPDDKTERKKYLYRKRYTTALPYKLERTDRTCKLCQETFPSYKRLLLHMPEHFPNHICNQCGKVFILKKHLEKHLKNTHSTTKVECPTCHKLVKKESLRRHLNIHTGNTCFLKCHYCQEMFGSYSSQVNHMIQLHGHKANEYKCNVCSRIFKLSSELSKHVKSVHLGEKKHKCEECDRHFFTSYQLKMHMVKHTQEKKFQCKVCQKRYGRKYTLSEHMKIHNNIKNFACGVCNRAFTQKCTLLSHIKTHEK